MVIEMRAAGKPLYAWGAEDVRDLLAYIEAKGKRPYTCLREFAAERGYPFHAVKRFWYKQVKHLYRGKPKLEAGSLQEALLRATAEKGGRLNAKDIEEVATACGVTYAKAFSVLGQLHYHGDVAVQDRADLVKEIESLKEQVEALKQRLEELEQFRLGLRQLVA